MVVLPKNAKYHTTSDEPAIGNVYSFNYERHSYLEFEVDNGEFEEIQIVHNPNCKCYESK